MDCRKSLVVALGLIGGAAGCVPSGSVQTVPPSPQVATTTKEIPRHPPKHAETCVVLGNFFAAEGGSAPEGSSKQEHSYDLARRQYQQALEIDAGCLSAYRALGRLYTTLHDQERAVATYQQALQKHPQEAVIWCDLGLCLGAQKDWAHAIEAFRRAVEFDAENRQYQNMLGFALARAGHTEESLGVFRKSVGEGQAQYNVARALLDMNERGEGRLHLQAAVQANPPCEPAQRLLAQLDAGEPIESGMLPTVFEIPAANETAQP